MAVITEDHLIASKMADHDLRTLTNDVVGVKRVSYEMPEGIHAIVELTFNCEHDLAYVFVFPEIGEAFAQLDYGFALASTKERVPFETYLTPVSIWNLASENENYPITASEDEDTHAVGIQVVGRLKGYLATI